MDISQLPLSNVTLEDFPRNALYCFSTNWRLNPLQDPARISGCYGICPNSAISGFGLRISVYAQTILILLLATIAPKRGDIRAAMLSASVSTLTIVAASIAEYRNNSLSFHHTVIVINLASLPTMAFLAAIIRLRSLKVVPFGPRLFSSFVIFVQFAGAVTLMVLAAGISSAVKNKDLLSKDNHEWKVSQPSCNRETVVTLLNWDIRFWQSNSDPMIIKSPYSTAIPILILGLVLLFLPLVICIFMLWKSQGSPIAKLFVQHFREAHLFKSNLPFWKRLVILFGTSLMMAWVAAIITNIEFQIQRNHVLPGERDLTYGQILSLMMIGVPVGHCISLLVQALMETKGGRKVIMTLRIEKVFGLQTPPPRRLTLAAEQERGKYHSVRMSEYDEAELQSPSDRRATQYSGSSTVTLVEDRPPSYKFYP
ncbi:hypothetical protein FRC02_002236 [Tulasnella sp. 418]|nr:hypothetical protein FRC02_002236 [Tulasnella sp. 418]